jgi:hypothetical protein
MSFAVSLNSSPTSPVTVNWATADGTATAPEDYASASGQLTFGVGETTKTVTVQVVGDLIAEPYETLYVRLSNATGAIVGHGEAVGTLANTDGISGQFRLMFHNTADNHLYRWHFKKEATGLPSLETFNWVTPFGPDQNWELAATMDLDRDGNLDYLWRRCGMNAALTCTDPAQVVGDGLLLVWYIDGDNLKGFRFANYQMAPPWRVVTSMDANGDGELDVVYYNESTGVVRVVLSNNGDRVSNYDLTTVPGAGWRPTAAQDADGDGQDDLILYNSTTGGIQAWKLSGANVTATLTYPNTQTTPEQFKLVSARADFNADGKPDFLWHNTTTGYFVTWFMNGTTRLGVGDFAAPFNRTDPTWRLVGAATLWP